VWQLSVSELSIEWRFMHRTPPLPEGHPRKVLQLRLGASFSPHAAAASNLVSRFWTHGLGTLGDSV
jgi:hypothetical protein